MLRIRKACKNEQGFSLIELLIVLLLMGLVFGIGYGIFGFTVSTFARSETKANTQQNMRLVMQHIENEVRYAKTVEILADEPTSIPADDPGTYIFINDAGKLEIASKDNNWILSDTLMDNTGFLLTFKREENNLLGIEVGNTKDTRVIYTKLNIINLSDNGGTITGVEVGETGPALYITSS